MQNRMACALATRSCAAAVARGDRRGGVLIGWSGPVAMTTARGLVALPCAVWSARCVYGGSSCWSDLWHCVRQDIWINCAQTCPFFKHNAPRHAVHDCEYFNRFFSRFFPPCLSRVRPGYGLCFEQAKSKCGQVTLLRAASMADQATACGQLANVHVIHVYLLCGLLTWRIKSCVYSTNEQLSLDTRNYNY